MTCKDCLHSEVCHVIKITCGFKAHAEILCEKFIDKDLINRQKADIEKQNDLIRRQSDVISEQKEKIERMYVDAVEEFADLSIKRISKNVTPIPQQRYLVNMCVQEIENTQKEMVSDNNE